MNEPNKQKPTAHDVTDADLRILRAVREVAYGSVEITIHNGRVVQVERREKIRMPQESSAPHSGRD
ncbi:MAG TPA: YezD family protein [Kiritimatiellia bacterium]|nr:YezD family protein [Kiritimatiellia bacterium]HMP33319.1 YezD family protein [Kiritimatiellia bacterium]